MIRVVNLVAVMVALLTSFALYRVKYEASDYAGQVAELRQEISAERERVNVLKAEWSYLNQPDRIQRLAERYLELQSLDARQIVTFRDLPERSREQMPYSPQGPASGFAGNVGDPATAIQ
jgi:cell division protein FtsL